MATLAENMEGIEDIEARMEEEVLVSWKSKVKPFKERSKDFYSTILVLATFY